IGGDKEIPYLHLAHEANPFLGIRGLRLALDHRELLVTQLRAIARAGAVANVRPRVMAPMVTTVEDVAMLHALADEAQVSLGVQGTSSDAGFELGIMVEVPSSALCARELAGDVAFLSIGSNDLTQYVMAIDRTHARLAPFANALHPAVLRLIRMTVEGADEAGIPVAVCGELAGDVAGALVLVGLGVDELSMDAGSLDEVRAALRSVSVAELEALAATALAARTAAEVRAAADALLESR
ncbi:MAG: putative PEP-binding protein, partial [Chloroflexota bacterium]